MARAVALLCKLTAEATCAAAGADGSEVCKKKRKQVQLGRLCPKVDKELMLRRETCDHREVALNTKLTSTSFCSSLLKQLLLVSNS